MSKWQTTLNFERPGLHCYPNRAHKSIDHLRGHSRPSVLSFLCRFIACHCCSEWLDVWCVECWEEVWHIQDVKRDGSSGGGFDGGEEGAEDCDTGEFSMGARSFWLWQDLWAAGIGTRFYASNLINVCVQIYVNWWTVMIRYVFEIDENPKKKKNLVQKKNKTPMSTVEYCCCNKSLGTVWYDLICYGFWYSVSSQSVECDLKRWFMQLHGGPTMYMVIEKAEQTVHLFKCDQKWYYAVIWMWLEKADVCSWMKRLNVCGWMQLEKMYAVKCDLKRLIPECMWLNVIWKGWYVFVWWRMIKKCSADNSSVTVSAFQAAR